MTGTTDGWTRLDARTGLADLKYAVGPLVPVGVAALVFGTEQVGQARVTLALVVGLSLAFYAGRLARLTSTRFRVGDGLVEMRRGVLARTHRTVPLDRVRGVDLKASPLHRVFRLTTLTIGTGQSFAGTELKPLVLDALGREQAERLRDTLLADPAAVLTPDPAGPAELARLDWRWLRFAPLSVTGMAAMWLLVAGAYKLVQTVGLDLLVSGPAGWLADRLAVLGPALAVTVVAVGVLAIGALGSLVLFAEAWWGYRLTREPDESLRVRRGLMTRRTVSLERSRLRGVQMTEPLPLRPWRAGALRAVTTGLSRGHGAALVGSATLLPPVPVTVAVRVAAAVLGGGPGDAPLGDPATGDPVPLRRHPRTALRRRIVRAAVLTGLLTAGAFALTTTGLAGPAVWLVPALAAPAAALCAVDSYRSLGHLPGSRYLVARSGTLRRTTVAIEHTGIIGWRISRSPTQRVAGLCTLIATCAAGRGYVPVRDVTGPQAVALACEVLAGPLEPFLVPDPGMAADPDRVEAVSVARGSDALLRTFGTL